MGLNEYLVTVATTRPIVERADWSKAVAGYLASYFSFREFYMAYNETPYERKRNG